MRKERYILQRNIDSIHDLEIKLNWSGQSNQETVDYLYQTRIFFLRFFFVDIVVVVVVLLLVYSDSLINRLIMKEQIEFVVTMSIDVQNSKLLRNILSLYVCVYVCVGRGGRRGGWGVGGFFTVGRCFPFDKRMCALDSYERVRFVEMTLLVTIDRPWAELKHL